MRLRKLAQILHNAWIAYAFVLFGTLYLWLMKGELRPQDFLVSMLAAPAFVYILVQGWKTICMLTGKDQAKWYFSWLSFLLQESTLFMISIALLVTFANVAFAKTAWMFYQRSTKETLQVLQNAQGINGSSSRTVTSQQEDAP